uniref:BHLH domain-containing protein n=1 Tax=Caenorhabditis japonica TaxID=281687 RepID=A0A8R1IC51_CAEJA
MQPCTPSSTVKPLKKHVYFTKKESEHKRESRSRHEKRRREEMNAVFAEMMSLLPEDVQRNVFRLQRTDQKPKKPDKCFIISNAVEFIKK